MFILFLTVASERELKGGGGGEDSSDCHECSKARQELSKILQSREREGGERERESYGDEWEGGQIFLLFPQTKELVQQ